MIATNTTLSREGVADLPQANEEGGLSGKPLFERSTQMLRELKKIAPSLPVIGVGGVDSVDSARAKFDAGASLVQLYTGLVYEGPELIKKLTSF